VNICISPRVRIQDGKVMLNQVPINYLTSRSRVFLDKIIHVQLLKKSPLFYGSRMFITAVPGTWH
jgi:hypothetical protein